MHLKFVLKQVFINVIFLVSLGRVLASTVNDSCGIILDLCLLLTGVKVKSATNLSLPAPIGKVGLDG